MNIFISMLILTTFANATSPDCDFAEQSAQAASQTLRTIKESSEVKEDLLKNIDALVDSLSKNCFESSARLETLANAVLDQALELNLLAPSLLTEEFAQQIYETVVAIEGASY